MEKGDSVNDTIDIFLATDPRCVRGCAVSMQSMMDNADPGAHLRFHLFFAPGVPESDRAALRRTVEESGRSASIRTADFDPAPLRHLSRSKLITHMAYAPFFLGELLPPEVSRCLVMDCDLVVERDIVELWNFDLEGLTAGVVNNGSEEEAARYRDRLGLREARYFNSGVLLVDLDRWRERDVGARAMEAAVRLGPRLILHDQDALNVALEGDWKLLPPHWNRWVILPGLQASDAIVFHYMGAPKPWHAGYDRPFREHFYRYLDRTPYRGWRPWNPAGLAGHWNRLRRTLPSVPGIVRAIRLRLDGGTGS